MTKQIISLTNKSMSIGVTIVYDNKSRWSDRMNLLNKLKEALIDKRIGKKK